MISDKNEFELWYRSFLDALEIMAEDAETQCRIMDYYNVAWEIMDDVFKGAELVIIANKNCGGLSCRKQDAITKFLSKIKGKVPEELLVFTDTEDANLSAMKHPCWISIRKNADELLRTMHARTSDK